MPDKRLPIGTIVFLPTDPDTPGKAVANLPRRAFVDAQGSQMQDFFVRVRWVREKSGASETEVPEADLRLFSTVVETYHNLYERYLRLLQAAQKM